MKVGLQGLELGLDPLEVPLRPGQVGRGLEHPLPPPDWQVPAFAKSG